MNSDKPDDLDRRQSDSASRTPWKVVMKDNVAFLSDRNGMPVANLQVFTGSNAHARFASNVALIVRACEAHFHLVALVQDMLPNLRAAAESDARTGITQSDAIRRYSAARNALKCASAKS